MQLVYGTSVNLQVVPLPVNGTGNFSYPDIIVYIPPGQQILNAGIQAIAAASASAIYSGLIVMTPLT